MDDPFNIGRSNLNRTREVALVSIFSALWIAAQLALGRLIGSFSIGPFSSHGIVNRLVGWLLMTILSELSGKFGVTSFMVSVSTLVTRIFRSNTLEGWIVGSGYIAAGIVFDLLYYRLSLRSKGFLKHSSILFIGFFTGLVASSPYIFSKLWLMGFKPFLVWLATTGIVSLVKNVPLSIIGSALGLIVYPKISILFGKDNK